MVFLIKYRRMFRKQTLKHPAGMNGMFRNGYTDYTGDDERSSIKFIFENVAYGCVWWDGF